MFRLFRYTFWGNTVVLGVGCDRTPAACCARYAIRVCGSERVEETNSKDHAQFSLGVSFECIYNIISTNASNDSNFDVRTPRTACTTSNCLSNFVVIRETVYTFHENCAMLSRQQVYFTLVNMPLLYPRVARATNIPPSPWCGISPTWRDDDVNWRKIFDENIYIISYWRIVNFAHLCFQAATNDYLFCI